MSDRLEQIKYTAEQTNLMLGPKDRDWLIAEVERLRAVAIQNRATIDAMISNALDLGAEIERLNGEQRLMRRNLPGECKKARAEGMEAAAVEAVKEICLDCNWKSNRVICGACTACKLAGRVEDRILAATKNSHPAP